ncbi:MAG: co-chaperone GroES [Candidatus Ranarchaeia archaeon]
MIDRPSIEDIAPTGDMILVEPIEVSRTSIGGILMPIDDSSPDEYGFIHAVGPGYYQNGNLVKPRVNAGDTIMELFKGE